MKNISKYLFESSGGKTLYCSSEYPIKNMRAFIFQSCVAEDIVMEALSKEWSSLKKTNESESGVSNQKAHCDIIGTYDNKKYNIDVKTPWYKMGTVPVVKTDALAIINEGTVYVTKYEDLTVKTNSAYLDEFIENAFYSVKLSDAKSNEYDKYFKKMMSISDESWVPSQGKDVLIGMLNEMMKKFGIKNINFEAV